MTHEFASQINELRESLDLHREALRVAIDELREAVEHLTHNLPDQVTWTEYLSSGATSGQRGCCCIDCCAAIDDNSGESEIPDDDSSKEELPNGRPPRQRPLFAD